jgi:hypothetical protein
MEKVEVVYFYKKCPHCGETLIPTQRLSGGKWLECRSLACTYVNPLTGKYDIFTCCYTSY